MDGELQPNPVENPRISLEDQAFLNRLVERFPNDWVYLKREIPLQHLKNVIGNEPLTTQDLLQLRQMYKQVFNSEGDNSAKLTESQILAFLRRDETLSGDMKIEAALEKLRDTYWRRLHWKGTFLTCTQIKTLSEAAMESGRKELESLCGNGEMEDLQEIFNEKATKENAWIKKVIEQIKEDDLDRLKRLTVRKFVQNCATFWTEEGNVVESKAMIILAMAEFTKQIGFKETEAPDATFKRFTEQLANDLEDAKAKLMESNAANIRKRNAEADLLKSIAEAKPLNSNAEAELSNSNAEAEVLKSNLEAKAMSPKKEKSWCSPL